MNLDLWSENQFDDAPEKAVPPAAFKRDSSASPRRLETTVISSLRQWLLNDYAAAYCRMLCSSPLYRRCNWIDAWESPSRSPTSFASENEASKLAHRQTRKSTDTHKLPAHLQSVAQLSSKLAAECSPRSFALYGIALEERTATRSARNTEHPVIPKEYGLVRAGWHESAPALLAALEQSPSIFLLLPFSRSLLTHDDLVPLYQRTNAPTELCLLLSHAHIDRYVTSALDHAPEAAALTELLRTDRWKTFRATQDAGALSSEGVIELLCAAMLKHLPFVQRIAVPLLKGAAVIEEAPYTLIFATRRKDSLICMNDAVCQRRRQLEEDSRRGLLSETWFAMQQQERLAEERQGLYEEALRTGSKQRIRRWPDLRQHLLLAHFGRFTLSEYDAVIRRLLHEGKVTCQWRQRDQEAGAMLPGTDDIVLWT